MNRLISIGILLFFIGVIIIIVASLLFFFIAPSSPSDKRVEGGVAGCIVIFFIPICFGAGSPSIIPLLIILALIMVVIMIIFLLIIHRSLFSVIQTTKNL
ncbi:MAG: hypothetical protein B6U89_01315 [Desulfurococcales archaeon ex4484_58]|nr:MAG: hypothetical protein B6U89_01315 [Desulfurococcales archaeon ex4484_58]